MFQLQITQKMFIDPKTNKSEKKMQDWLESNLTLLNIHNYAFIQAQKQIWKHEKKITSLTYQMN